MEAENKCYVFWNVFKKLYRAIKESISSNIADLFYSKSAQSALKPSKHSPRALGNSSTLEAFEALYLATPSEKQYSKNKPKVSYNHLKSINLNRNF